MNNKIINDVIDNIEKVLIGRSNEVINILKGILAGGHILIDDVPGVGKTTLIKVLAKTLSLTCNRIQFTPDLLPTDITGVSIFNQKSLEFEFRKGPIFSNVILADEINRATPRTQSALLQAMEERQVTEGSKTYKIGDPFIVLATENPIEYEGTFPLPEAELDRFIIKTSIGYPEFRDEIKILQVYKDHNPMNNIKSIFNEGDIKEIQEAVKHIHVELNVYEYIVNVIEQTRNNEYIKLGASVRGSMALMRVAQANAFIQGRKYVIPEDVKENVKLVLSHRLVLSSLALKDELTVEDIIDKILNRVPMPKVIIND
ncbi:AAA family ATPase [Hathewaya limosa]|uniref:MoxR-like ATPase n=1 Tax=Hathewaya limosa TaxID=1536 RepID=A0ABU0JVA3_HATLI|nr:MoxR family ATPase [Hathewaya limosa]MDQ0480989.1 MoxR-like ATPase [Hathewaya limosa]